MIQVLSEGALDRSSNRHSEKKDHPSRCCAWKASEFTNGLLLMCSDVIITLKGLWLGYALVLLAFIIAIFNRASSSAAKCCSSLPELMPH